MNIVSESYITSRIKYVEFSVKELEEGPRLTMCFITMINGFVVTGESACADPRNFNQQTGEEIAYNNAFEKLWPLEGYLLKERMYEKQIFGKC